MVAVDNTIEVFLSYASEDRHIVNSLYDDFEGKGLNPWMDKKDIHPGEDWERSIWRAARRSDFFLICLSKVATGKRGFLQREIKRALSIWEEKLEDDIYLIPIRLEECDVPRALQKFQWVDLFAKDGFERLVDAIETGAQRRELISKGSEFGNGLSIVKQDLSEEKQGAVSYRITIEYPRIEGTNESWKNEINGVLSGIATEEVQNFRKSSLKDLNNEELGARLADAASVNEFSMTYDVAIFEKNVLSIVFSVSWYGAGAAHPNHGTFTKNYQLNPTLPIELRDMFQSEVDYLKKLSEICLRDLKRQAKEDFGDNIKETHLADSTWKDGVAPENENFQSFKISSGKLVIMFDPYQVGPYAWGSRQVEIPFERLQDYIDVSGPLGPLVASYSAA